MTTNYTFGWRPSLPDFRDREYVPAFRGALPPAVDLTGDWPLSKNLHQYQLGSCGPQSAAKDILFSYKRQGLPAAVPSRLFIYWNARYLMGTVNEDSGVDNRSLLKAVSRWGWCDENTWAYDESKFRVRPGQVAFDEAAKRAGCEYLAVGQSLDVMKACMASGDPFIFGFSVFSNMLTDAVDATGEIPMPGGRLEGGHDVTFVGYDDAKQSFKLFNHWQKADGSEWGVNGFGWIPYAFATNPKMASDFWTIRRVAGSPVPPQPAPTPPPAPAPLTPVAYLNACDKDGKVLKSYYPR